MESNYVVNQIWWIRFWKFAKVRKIKESFFGFGKIQDDGMFVWRESPFEGNKQISAPEYGAINAHCQDMNTSHRHLYVFTGCRLSLESISRLLCSVSRPQLSKKQGRHQEDFDIQPPLEHQYPVGRPFTTIEKNAWRSSQWFPMIHPPRFGTLSRNRYIHCKILTPLSHCLVFHIVYIFAFYCK